VTVGSEGRVIGDVEALAEPAALTEYERGAARARTMVAAATFEPCSRSYNTVVLPDARDGGGWIAYLLPGTTKHDVIPIGGSYRLDLDASGRKITRQRPFTRTCIALERPRGQKGMETVAMMITHLLDPVPTEVHVFWSRWAHTPMFVATSMGTWLIEDGRITLADRREEQAP
jgi:hypothetical protein